MPIENFQARYTSIPLATFSRSYKKNSQPFDFSTLPHLHKELEILLVLEGKAQVQINSIWHTIQKGNIVVLPPYTLHCYTICADYDFKHYCLCMDLDVLYDKRMKEDLENGSLSILNIIDRHPPCARYIEDIFISEKDKKDGWELSVIGNIHLLFGAFKESNYFKICSSACNQSVYYKICNFIEKHYKEDITSTVTSKALGFSNSYFCRLFHKSFGETFQNHLCRFRIEKSKQLLQYTDRSISQISADVGFNSFSYFSKKFREYNHITPISYRTKQKRLD